MLRWICSSIIAIQQYMGNMLEISKIEKADLMVIDYARFQTISCFPTDYIPFVNIACNIGTAVAVQCYWVDFFSA